MGRFAAWAWCILGALLAFVAIVDVPRLLKYRDSFPMSRDWVVGLWASGVVALIGVAAVAAGALEATRGRSPLVLRAPAAAVLCLMLVPWVFVGGIRAFNAQFLFYALPFELFGYGPFDLALAALLVLGIGWIDTRLSAGTSAAR